MIEKKPCCTGCNFLILEPKDYNDHLGHYWTWSVILNLEDGKGEK